MWLSCNFSSCSPEDKTLLVGNPHLAFFFFSLFACAINPWSAAGKAKPATRQGWSHNKTLAALAGTVAYCNCTYIMLTQNQWERSGMRFRRCWNIPSNLQRRWGSLFATRFGADEGLLAPICSPMHSSICSLATERHLIYRIWIYWKWVELMIQCDLFQIDWLLNRLKGYLNNGPDFWKWRYGAKDSRKCLNYKINPDRNWRTICGPFLRMPRIRPAAFWRDFPRSDSLTKNVDD